MICGAKLYWQYSYHMLNDKRTEMRCSKARQATPEETLTFDLDDFNILPFQGCPKACTICYSGGSQLPALNTGAQGEDADKTSVAQGHYAWHIGVR